MVAVSTRSDNCGASSLSVIVISTASGTPTSGSFVAPVTESTSSDSAIRSSSGVRVKPAETLVSPAIMLSVSAATGTKSTPDTAPSPPVPLPTVTVTTTSDSRSPEFSVAVTSISVAPAISATEVTFSDRDTESGASSLSRIVSVGDGLGALMPVVRGIPSAPSYAAMVPEIVNSLSGVSRSLSTAEMVASPVLAVAPAAKSSSPNAGTGKSVS